MLRADPRTRNAITRTGRGLETILLHFAATNDAATADDTTTTATTGTGSAKKEEEVEDDENGKKNTKYKNTSQQPQQRQSYFVLEGRGAQRTVSLRAEVAAEIMAACPLEVGVVVPPPPTKTKCRVHNDWVWYPATTAPSSSSAATTGHQQQQQQQQDGSSYPTTKTGSSSIQNLLLFKEAAAINDVERKLLSSELHHQLLKEMVPGIQYSLNTLLHSIFGTRVDSTKANAVNQHITQLPRFFTRNNGNLVALRKLPLGKEQLSAEQKAANLYNQYQQQQTSSSSSSSTTTKTVSTAQGEVRPVKVTQVDQSNILLLSREKQQLKSRSYFVSNFTEVQITNILAYIPLDWAPRQCLRIPDKVLQSLTAPSLWAFLCSHPKYSPAQN